jgi:hypothetical protein
MIDDQTTAYIVNVQVYFEDLKQVAAQLAGLLVLGAAGAAPDHPMLASAGQAYENAADGLKSLRVPPQARTHHNHLVAAAAKLDEALRANGDTLRLLEGAYAELRWASRTLPGFQMISFEQGCCAVENEAHRPKGPLCAVEK